MESLPNHWDELAKILEPIHINHLATQHLESCNYKILDYWDSNNKFYEEIALIHPICAESIGRSISLALIPLPLSLPRQKLPQPQQTSGLSQIQR